MEDQTLRETCKKDILQEVAKIQKLLTTDEKEDRILRENEIGEEAYDNFRELMDDVVLFDMNLLSRLETYCCEAQMSKRECFSVAIQITKYMFTVKMFTDAGIYAKELHPSTFPWHELWEYLYPLLGKHLQNFNKNVFEQTLNETKSIGSFLALTDTALDKLDQIDAGLGPKLYLARLEESYMLMEEVMGVAMSIAYVAIADDDKKVTAGCRSVIESVQNARTEIKADKANVPMCNLCIETCRTTLCEMEARVNTAVLRLCLITFASFEKPVEKLFEACRQRDSESLIGERTKDFDLHMDRLFQIALFSIACSTIGKYVAAIKAIISHLEFFERELVPIFVSMVKEKQEKFVEQKRNVAEVLKKTWSKQIKMLRKAVHGVIEPSAYCKVIYKELRELVDYLTLNESNHDISFDNTYQTIVSYTHELGCMIKSCLDSFDQPMKDRAQKQLLNVHKITHELNAAVKLAPGEDSRRQIHKRCQILLATVKRLLEILQDDVEISSHKKSENVTNGDSSPFDSDKENSVMKELKNKGKSILKEKSLHNLDKTAAKFSENALIRTMLGNRSTRLLPQERSFSRRQVEVFSEKQLFLLNI